MEEQQFNPEQYMSNIETENETLRQKNLELSGAMTSQGFMPEEVTYHRFFLLSHRQFTLEYCLMDITKAYDTS